MLSSKEKDSIVNIKYFLLLFVLLFLTGCGEGLSPGPEETVNQTGFGGTVYFKGEWPDSVKRTYIAAFRNEIQNAGDFFLQIGFISDSIPRNTKQIIYSSQVNPLVPIKAGQYKYIVVAQSATDSISFLRKDWRVAGIYYMNGDSTKPGSIVLNENEFIKDINITCDFDNPPPQPPGG